MNDTEEIYLDNNASTQPLDSVIETVVSAMKEGYGNPSSVHRRGSDARRKLAFAREIVAEFLGADSDQIVFTSGGTEGNNTVLKGVTQSRTVRRLVTSTVEHLSVLRPAETIAEQGTEVLFIPVDVNGRIHLHLLEETLSSGLPALLSIQWANSETGVIQPIEEISEIAHKYGNLLHVDAAQAIGRIPIDLCTISVDFLTFSGHKLHAPLGTGVLHIRKPQAFTPLLLGGGQEDGLRSGTENLPGILGLARACEIRMAGLHQIISDIQRLRDRFEQKIVTEIPNTLVNGVHALRVCNTANIRFNGVDGQALLARLDQANILCSQTSACSSHRPEPSHVLRAMGLSEDEAFSSLRFSFSVLNTENEVDRSVQVIRDTVMSLRKVFSI